MELDIGVVISTLIGLFLLIAVGFTVARLRIIPKDFSKPLCALLMQVTLPATVFLSLLRPLDPNFLSTGMIMLGLGTGLLVLYIVLTPLLSHLFRVDPNRRGMWSFCATFCNNGFMGYPIVLALFGDQGLALAVILAIPWSFFVYSLGIQQILMDCPEDTEGVTVPLKEILFTMCNFSLVLGLIFYFCQIPVPQALLTPISYLADATTPLSMIVVGMALAESRITDILRDRDCFTTSFTRLLLFPLLTFLVLQPFHFSDPLISQVTLVTMAMPAASMSTILAEQYGGFKELGARSVFLSSFLCMATIPLICLLL